MKRLLLGIALLLAGCGKSPSLVKDLPAVPATALVGGEGRLAFVGADGVLYGLDASAAQKWKFSTAKASTRYPPVVAGKIVCVLSGNSLCGVSLADGKLKWRYTLLGGVGPGTAGDDYILAQGSHELTLLNAASGKPVKRSGLGGPAGVPPVGRSDYAYCVRLGPAPDPEDRFAPQMVSVHGLLVPSLEEIWRQECEEGTVLGVDDDLLVFLKSLHNTGGTSTEAQAWSRKSGRQAWTWGAGTKAASVAQRPSFSDETAYMAFTTGLDAFVVAVKAKELWRTPLPINAAGSVVVTPTVLWGELVLVGEENGLVALDRNTGKKKWAADELEGKVVGAPLVLGDTVYVATDKKKLYGVKL